MQQLKRYRGERSSDPPFSQFLGAVLVPQTLSGLSDFHSVTLINVAVKMAALIRRISKNSTSIFGSHFTLSPHAIPNSLSSSLLSRRSIASKLFVGGISLLLLSLLQSSSSSNYRFHLLIFVLLFIQFCLGTSI